MMEYIEREIKSKKITLPENYDCVQVSVNSWGHLVIRFFNNQNPDKDVVIVFDAAATGHIIRYIKKYLKEWV